MYVYKHIKIGKQTFKILTLIQINYFFHIKVNFRYLVKFVKYKQILLQELCNQTKWNEGIIIESISLYRMILKRLLFFYPRTYHAD